eukprot:1184177-Prorocentrum_minimum.AAC.4
MEKVRVAALPARITPRRVTCAVSPPLSRAQPVRGSSSLVSGESVREKKKEETSPSPEETLSRGCSQRYIRATRLDFVRRRRR